MLVESLPRFSAAQSNASRRRAPRWPAVTGTELMLRLRNTSAPIILICAAAAAVLLTPPADANYAVITFGGMKPVMSAGTSIVAAGMVLSLLLFPVYVLGLGVGCSRDRRLRTGAVLASSPVSPATLLCGRMIANAILVVLFSLMSLCLVAVVSASRFKSLPDAAAVAAYILVVVPCGLCSLPAAALLDRYLTDRDGEKASVMIALWSVLMICSIAAWPDVFGLLLLKQNAPAGAGLSEFSVGVVVADHMGKIPWASVALSPSFVAARLSLMAALLPLFALVCMAAGPGMKAALSRAPERSPGGGAAPVQPRADLPRMRPARMGLLSTAPVLWQHWFLRANWTRLSFAAGLLISLAAPRSTRLTLGVALLIPLSVFNMRRISGERRLRELERSTAALWRPSPLLFTALVLAAVTAIPVLPAFAQLPAARSVHVAVAILGAALWLTWSCAAMERPLLGISVYAVIWYLESFSDIPPAADLLGFGATSALSFAAALGLTIALGILVLRRDLYALRSSRYL